MKNCLKIKNEKMPKNKKKVFELILIFFKNSIETTLINCAKG